MVTHSTYRTLEVDFLGALANALVDLRGSATLAFELIQNADDADGATRMSFDVRDEALVVENDGLFTDCDDQDSPECPWMETRRTRCDFHSFRLVQGGTKRDRDDTTGAFGIGFTSVYQITDQPELTSGSRQWVVRLGAVLELSQRIGDLPAQLLLDLQQRVRAKLPRRTRDNHVLAGQLRGRLHQPRARLPDPVFLGQLKRTQAAGRPRQSGERLVNSSHQRRSAGNRIYGFAIHVAAAYRRDIATRATFSARAPKDPPSGAHGRLGAP